MAGLFSGLGSVNTPSTRSFSHALTFGIDLAVFTNVLQFVYVKTKRSRGGKPFWTKWAPFNLLVVALFLIMADLTRHLINDAWGTSCTELDRGSHPDSVLGVSYSGKSDDFVPIPSENNKYCHSVFMANEFKDGGGLTIYGWVFTIICTWTGFACFIVGVFWVMNLPAKFRAQWQVIRSARAARGVNTENGNQRLVDSRA